MFGVIPDLVLLTAVSAAIAFVAHALGDPPR